MQHSKVAVLRHQLRNTSDTVHLLREALGHLGTFFVHQPQSLTLQCMENILLCKAIFDQYRIRLNAQNHQPLSLEEIHCVVDSLQVLTAIRRDTNKRPNTGTTQWKQDLITRAFFAGVRVLNLTRHPKALECLRECRGGWEQSSSIDSHIIQPVLSHVAGGNLSDAVRGRVVVEVDSNDPMRFLGSRRYLLDRSKNCVSEWEERNPQALLFLFDVKLAMINASCELMQQALMLDPQRRAAMKDCLDQIAEFASDFKNVLLRAREGSSGPSLLACLETLEPAPHCTGCVQSCSCFPATDRQNPVTDDTMSRLYDSLHTRLRGRTLGIFNGHQKFSEVMHLVHSKTQEWLENQDTRPTNNGSTPLPVMNRRRSERRRAPSYSYYVLDCPAVHCVSGDTLLEWINKTVNTCGIDSFVNGDRLVEVDINCELCQEASSAQATRRTCLVRRARKIDALTQIWIGMSAMQEEWRQWESKQKTVIQEELREHVVPATEAPSTSMRPIVSISREEPLTNSDTRRSSTNLNPSTPGTPSSSGSVSRISSVFGLGGHNRTKSNFKNISFESAITPHGRYLAVWHKPQLAVYDVAQKCWSDPNIDGDIRLVSMASEVLFVVSNLASTYKVFVIQLSSCEQIGEAVTFDDEIVCLASSLDGSQAIMATATNIIRLVFNPQARTRQETWLQQRQSLRRHSAVASDSNMRLESGSVAFSSDGSRAVLAIRYRPGGRVYVSIYLTKQGNQIERLLQQHLYDLPLNSARDFGLTAVSCIHDARTQITTYSISSSMDSGFQVLYKFEEQTKRNNLIEVVPPDALSPSIHRAVAVSQGSSAFLLLNENMSNLWVARPTANPGRWMCYKPRLKTGPLAYSQNERPRIQLAAATAEEVYICCVERGELKIFCYDATNRTSIVGQAQTIKLTPFLTT